MKELFGNEPAGYVAFAAKAAADLGAERDLVTERVDEDGVYHRAAHFTKIAQPIETIVAFDGAAKIAGFAVRPTGTPEAAPTTKLDYQGATKLRLPFTGTWTVFWGGKTIEQYHHASVRDQRFAYDLVVIDLLGRLAGSRSTPQAVFTTAYDQHALRAFEVNALDYLLKPIEPERLAEAIARIRPPAPSSPLEAAAPLDRLFVRDGARCWFVPLAEVAVCTTEGNSTRLSWKTENPLVPRSLVALEPRLPPSFFRASRAAILNLDFVEGIDAGVGGRLHAQLRGGVEIEISRRQARAFRERCGL